MYKVIYNTPSSFLWGLQNYIKLQIAQKITVCDWDQIESSNQRTL